MTEIKWNPITFGQLEGLLASQHSISDGMRTKFQARLKNLHRLNYPAQFQSTKGKATLYQARHVIDMALAVEMTQLGLSPERIVGILSVNGFATMMATRAAARYLSEDDLWPDFDGEGEYSSQIPTIFLYFDPSGLADLTDMEPKRFGPDFDMAAESFFYADGQSIEDNLVPWTMADGGGRVSLINVTCITHNIAFEMFADDPKQRRAFYDAIVDENDKLEAWNKNDEAPTNYFFKIIDYNGYLKDAEMMAAMLPESPKYQEMIKTFAGLMLISEQEMGGMFAIAEDYIRKVVDGDT